MERNGNERTGGRKEGMTEGTDGTELRVWWSMVSDRVGT